MTDRDPGRLPPPPRSYRWLVFACISVAMFANYYVFDALNPVGPHLEKELGFTQAQIGLLDSVYNIAALIVLLIGGIIIDRVGTKRALVAFGIVAAAGGLLIALSPGGYPGMAAGRFVLGMGSEPLIVAITTALAKWFKGKELSFAIALNLTFGRLGSVAADNSPNWASAFFTGWQPPLFLAAGIGAGAVAAGAVLLPARAARGARVPPGSRGHRRPAGGRRPPGELGRSFLVDRGPLRDVLLGDLPVPPLREHLLHRRPRRVAGNRRVAQRPPAADGHGRHAAVRPAGGPHRQARAADGNRIGDLRSHVPAAGAHHAADLPAGRDARRGFLAHSRRDVALGGLPGR